MPKKQPCTTCGGRPVHFFRECHVCRKQWKAFYSGSTHVSPLMRAIEAEKASHYTA